VINPVNAAPELIRNDSKSGNNWLKIKLIGVKSTRNGIGARIKVTTEDGAQIEEVRSGSSYYSQNDLRVNFGVGKAAKVKSIEIKWLSGQIDTLSDVPVNQIIAIKEGIGVLKK
jgi:enediyne biosynthesis protein E4